MSDSELIQLEGFFFSESKEDFIKKLINGTDSYYYFTLLTALNKYGLQLPKEHEENLEKYKKFSTVRSRNIQLRNLLLKLDKTEKDEDRKSLTEQINRLIFHYDFRFDQPKSVTTTNFISVVEKVSSVLDESQINLGNYIENANKTTNDLNALNAVGQAQLELNNFVKADINVVRVLLGNINLADFEGVPDFLKLYFEQQKSKNANYQLESFFFPKMTLEQMKKLQELLPDINKSMHYVGELMRKEFKLDPTEKDKPLGTPEEKEERRKKLLEIYNWSKGLPHKFLSLSEQLLYEILNIGIENNFYDYDLFVEYLKDPKSITKYANKNQSNCFNTRKRNYENYWHEVHSCKVNAWLSDESLIENYLESYFKKNDSIKPFDEYLDSDKLVKIFNKVKLSLGKEVTNITEIFSAAELKALNEEKLITICKHNRQFFKAEEEVKLFIEIKNIPVLLIKVFEFCPENYYQKNMKEIDSQINLDGLIASEEISFNFSEAPVVKTIHEFKFEKISQRKQGVFIIEFVGNGISSRAIIRKGRLLLIQKTTLLGNIFTILDENLDICKGSDRTGIWVENNFHAANSTGQVVIPFSSSARLNLNAIIIHNNFASLAVLNIHAEVYAFKCSFLYSNESIVMGNKAKILLQTRLYINNEPANLEIIKDRNVTVTTVNDTDIPSTIEFDKIKFSADEEAVLEIPIPAKLKRVTINVTGKIKKIDGSTQEVNGYSELYVNNYENQNTFCLQSLRYTTEEGYAIYFLGKNGEGKPGINLKVTLQNRFLTNTNVFSLQTDKEGKVVLGQLPNIVSVTSYATVKGDIQADAQTWSLNYNSKTSYPSVLRICEGDSITLPYFDGVLNNKKISFNEAIEIKGQRTIIRNMLSTLKVDGNALMVEGLKEGLYFLNFIESSQTIRVQVIKGSYWKKTNMISTSEKLITVNKNLSPVVIEKVDIKPDENGKGQVSIKIFTDRPKLTRVHLYAYNFHPHDIEESVRSLKNNLLAPAFSVVSNVTPRNIFLSNRRLGDEYCYVLERKKQTRYVGNNLDKPPVLLKRQLVGDTTFEQENLQRGGGYAQKTSFEDEQRVMEDLIMMERDYQEPVAEAMSYRPQEQARKMVARQADYRGQSLPESRVSPGGINSLLNFLHRPSTIYPNLHPDEKGLIILNDFPLSSYSTIQIIATDLDTVVSTVVPLMKSNIVTRDLSQKSSLEKNHFYSIFRDCALLQKDETFKVKDFTSTDYKIIDSLSTLFNLQKELKLCNGSDVENGKGFNIWEFLKKWETHPIDEKHKKYNEFTSHELNIFLYFKDRPYFDTYVKGYLSNKIEKTIVDYVLLEDKVQISKYLSNSSISTLNTLEKILLINYLKENGDTTQAKELANLLDNENKIKTYDINVFKRYFDTVLNSKSAELPQIMPVPPQFDAFGPPPGMGGMLFGAGPPMMMMAQNIAPQSSCFSNFNAVQNCAMPMRRIASPPMMMSKQAKCMDLMEDECFMALNSDPFSNYEQVEQQRKQFRQEFKNLEKTKEYKERQYFNQTGSNTNTFHLVSTNTFWVELAKHIVEKGLYDVPFLSKNFIYCSNNHTEMIAVLTFISLPFEAGNHVYTPLEGKGLSIKAASNIMIFQKEIKESKSDLKNDILIAQRFFDPKDRYTFSDEDASLKLEKDVDEYIVDKIYGCQVIVTNCSVTNQEFQILIEVPEGSIPVFTVDYTKSHTLTINSYTTRVLENFFYFPRSGAFKLYPANISRNGVVVAVARDTIFEVNDERKSSKLETLDQILSKGSKEDILNFVATRNILNPQIFTFSTIYYLLKDKDFYVKLLEVLRKRKVYDHTTWSFSLYHGEPQSLKEFFQSQAIQDIFKSTLRNFESSLLSVKNMSIYEYFPFMNSRVHTLTSDRSNILNINLRNQYKKFVEYLGEAKQPTIEDLLCLIYYLVLQDRLDEAIKVFKTIDPSNVAENGVARLQYDYFSAYLDFYIGYPNFKVARDICEKYLDFPIINWRNLFYEIANQIAEYDGEEILEIENADEEKTKQEDAKKKNLKNALKEEVLSLELEGTNLNLTVCNISSINIRYYQIDLEVLFSRNPFLSQGDEDFSFVQPNFIETKVIENSQDLQKLVIKIPQKLELSNIFIQVTSQNKKASVTYFSSSLKVNIVENYGQVKVLDTKDKPISKVYVKTFAKEKNGNVSFYKDGYTDLRGRFDYASLSSGSIDNIEKFAIFIMSDELGSIMREVKAPAKIGKMEGTVELKSKSWQAKSENAHIVQTNNYIKATEMWHNKK